MTFTINDLTPNTAPTSSFELIVETATTGVYNRVTIADLLKATAVQCPSLETTAGGVTIDSSGDLVFEGATANTTLSANATAARTITLPDASGQVLLGSGWTDNRLLRANGASAAQDSGITIDDSDNVTGVAGLTMTGTLSGADATLSGALAADTIQAVGAGTTVTVDDDLIVSGDLTVNGSATQIDTEITLQDALTKHADGNVADTLDIGFFGEYDGGSGARYAGWFRDASDGKWRLFDGLQSEPTTAVNIAGTGYSAADVVLGAIEAASATLSGTLSVNTIADVSGGTITLDDNTTVNGSLSATDTITSTKAGAGLSAGFGVSSITPSLFLNDTDQAADERLWDVIGSNGQFRIRALNDAVTLASDALTVQRSLSTVTSVSLGASWATFTAGGATLGTGVDLTLNGGVFADSTGTITLDDPVKLSSGTATTVADALNVDSSNKGFHGHTAGIGGLLQRTLAVGYSDRTQSGIVTQQTLLPASIRGGVTAPADYYVPGRVVRYFLAGKYTTDVSPGTATIRILLGGTVFRTIGSFTPDASVTDGIWRLEGCITCQTDGATGTVQGVAKWEHEQASGAGQPWHVEKATSSSPVTIDTTGALAFDVDWTATDAGTSITTTCFQLVEM